MQRRDNPDLLYGRQETDEREPARRSREEVVIAIDPPEIDSLDTGLRSSSVLSTIGLSSGHDSIFVSIATSEQENHRRGYTEALIPSTICGTFPPLAQQPFTT